MKRINQLLENNRSWSARIKEEDPNFFPALAEQQNPEYLWIGCSDSRVSANMLLGLDPGEVFVHRNVANLVNHTDMNCLSVVQFAVDVLKVEHIIVCGHYGCGGVLAAFNDQRFGLIDNWLRQIQDTAKFHSAALDEVEDQQARFDLLCELNVAEQVRNVGETTIVHDAWGRGQKLFIHGWIYGLKDGMIRDLDITIKDESSLKDLRQAYSINDHRNTAGGTSF